MADHNTLLVNLDNEELLRHFHAQHDPLTTTPIADELAKRFEKLLTTIDAVRASIEDVRTTLDNIS